jgi:hypothetical protein
MQHQESSITPIGGGRSGGRRGIPTPLPMPARIFTIFEGTSEIQRMIIGMPVTGLTCGNNRTNGAPPPPRRRPSLLAR